MEKCVAKTGGYLKKAVACYVKNVFIKKRATKHSTATGLEPRTT